MKNTVHFKNGSSRETLHGLYQWSYGQLLEIEGVEIDGTVWVQFSMNESGGDAFPVFTELDNGVIRAEIPGFVFEKETTKNYTAYAFIYISDTRSGKTVKVVKMMITARPKPDDYIYTEPEKQRYEMLEERINELEENGIPGGGNIVVDSELSETSENPVQNKVVDKAFKDLGKRIPTKTSQLKNDSEFLTEHQDLSGYAEKATTLEGYGITDGATKEAVKKLSKEIVVLNNLKKITKTGTEILIDKEMKIVSSNLVPIEIYHTNRFDFNTMSLTVSSYNSSHTITRENNGLKIARNLLTTQEYLYQTSEYIAEFNGNLWISCDTKAKNIMDALVKIYVNDVEIESLYGDGRVYCCVPVLKNDVVKIRFYSCVGNTETDNEIFYSNIMLQYETFTDFVKYKQNSTNGGYLTKDFVLDGTNNGLYNDWTTMPTKNGKYYFLMSPIDDMLVSTYPTYDTDIGDWSADFTQITPIEVQREVEGISVFTNGKIGIYLNDVQSRADLPAYLKSNPITITYKYDTTGVSAIEIVEVGEILVSEENIRLIGYVKDSVKDKTINHVAFGDSITGMYGYGTSYPEMITRMSKNINSINVGFSGTQVTDHSDVNYKAFSFNKLVDSIVNNDWTLQDNAVANIDKPHYVEHLETLKNINFKNVNEVSLLYGTNDWGNGVLLETFKTVYIESIRKFLTAFPHLKVIVITPYWRAISNGKDSNIDANSNNEYLYDFADSIVELTSKNFNCLTINYYRTLGANVITNRYFTQDGTHPTFRTREKIAKDLIKLMG